MTGHPVPLWARVVLTPIALGLVLFEKGAAVVARWRGKR